MRQHHTSPSSAAAANDGARSPHSPSAETSQRSAGQLGQIDFSTEAFLNYGTAVKSTVCLGLCWQEEEDEQKERTCCLPSLELEVSSVLQVFCVGQLVCAVIADSEVQAKRAPQRVKIVYQDLEPLILTIEVMSSRVGPEEHIQVVYHLKCQKQEKKSDSKWLPKHRGFVFPPTLSLLARKLVF